VDLTFDGPEAALGRYGTIPRNGGSRLKLEISKDSKNSTFVESPKPTSAATPTPGSFLPQRGRPKLHFDVPSVSNPIPRSAQDGGHSDVIIKSMPLPVRPGQHIPPAHEKLRISLSNSAKKDARPKPYVLEVPSAAPKYSPNGHADFFPWTGNHPEDQFSDTAIRNGFYDKAQMTQNETGSAKPTLFPALKHKSGLQTLSSLFTSVLAQRRSHGHINSNSTFKPPPRVTVTDTKREMWLKDLANPTISLRRLSRSIPHGIRGKVLLDQSLSKNIPIERAVWLAKCVGANELRSFRRKGVSGTFAMGGEAKWIRDFTVCVEQFIENIVGSCGEKDFKSRINYAIRLAVHFYAENLLDREHYMDWLVSALENSVPSKLPLWLLVTQMYWKDLLQYRKFGRRLAAALLGLITEVTNHLDSDVLAPVSDRLKSLTKDLMASSPESFVSPKLWMRHRAVVHPILISDDHQFEAVFASIDRRNGRIAALSGTGRCPSSRRRLISSLDTTLSNVLTTDHVKDCWEIDDDKTIIVQTLLDWSTSWYRPGITKVYVAARMLRQWALYGADITESVLDFLDSSISERGRNRACLYHLVAELARSEHFSASIYLQWVIARGGLDSATDAAENGPCATRLLAELPTHNLSESMTALRATLLHRINISVDEEEDLMNSYIYFLNNLLPGMEATVDLQSEKIIDDPDRILSSMSRTSKSEIGLWLRQKVGLQMVQPTIPPLDDWDDSPMKEGTSAITASQFNTVRHHLELIDDYSILADVLKIVTSSNDAEILASCADSLGFHLDTFAAIGALNGIFEILVDRLRSLSEDEVPPRILLVALLGVATRIPGQSTVAQQLIQELARSDRKTAADACSPVSDHMAGVVQMAEANFTDEIERVLASGNSMDQATLERLFQRIARRFEGSWEKSAEHRSCGLLFTRLRTFDAQQFDILMSAWVNSLLQIEFRPSMIQIFGPLIGFGCLNLRDVISNCLSMHPVKESSSQPDLSSRNSQEMLVLIMTSTGLSEVITAEELYRLHIKQRNFQKDHHINVLDVIRSAIDDSGFSDAMKPGSSRHQIKAILSSSEMHELLQRLVLMDTDLTIHTLFTPLLQSTRPVVSTASVMVDSLLIAERKSREQSPISIEAVLNLADDFTLPFCKVKLASMFRLEDGSAATSGNDYSEHLQALDNATESAISAENTAWACILPLFDVSVSQHVRARAEMQFFALFPREKTTLEDVATIESRVKQAENLLYIIEVASSSMAISPSSNLLVSEIVTTFLSTWLLLSNTHEEFAKLRDLVVSKWLPLLLTFVTIHTSAFEVTKSGHENRAKALTALTAIFLELQALKTTSHAIVGLIEQTFDVATQLVDLLPDDLRHQCIRSLRDTTTNYQISYLFSITTNPSEWLMLNQKEKNGGSVGTEGRNIVVEKEKLCPFPLRRWEMLGEPTPNVGENDTSLSLKLFGARRE